MTGEPGFGLSRAGLPAASSRNNLPASEFGSLAAAGFPALLVASSGAPLAGDGARVAAVAGQCGHRADRVQAGRDDHRAEVGAPLRRRYRGAAAAGLAAVAGLAVAPFAGEFGTWAGLRGEPGR